MIWIIMDYWLETVKTDCKDELHHCAKPPLPRRNKNVFRKCFFGGEREMSVLFIHFIGVFRKEEMLTEPQT